MEVLLVEHGAFRTDESAESYVGVSAAVVLAVDTERVELVLVNF